jgi:hypothetical protein
MKTIIAALLLSIIISPVIGQTIKYEKTFEDALKKASAQKKLVFLIMTAPLRSEINEAGGIDQPDAVNKFNENFVCYKVSITDTASIRFRKKYPSNAFPVCYFLDKNGNPIYRDNKNSREAAHYIEMADNAIKRASSGKTLSDYDATYRAGKVDETFLREYIIMRQNLGIDSNAKLIDEYVKYLPVRSLDNYQEVLFILKAGPIAFGRTYNLAFNNRKLFDSIYKTEPFADRIAINQTIIKNTFQLAVANKDATMAQNLSNFIQNTYNPDYRFAAKAYSQNMVSYYYAVKDTANYLQQASFFYDSYYMSISVDSAKKLMGTKAISSGTTNKGRSIQRPKGTVTYTRLVTVSYGSMLTQLGPIEVPTTLNNAAYYVYATGTRNSNYLLKAINWSKRSLEINDEPNYHDTLAHLLYRYGFYAEAAAEQNLAISKLNKTSKLAKQFKDELEKIKKRTL